MNDSSRTREQVLGSNSYSQVEDQLTDISPASSQSSLFSHKSKYLHIIYWIIVALLVWNLWEVSRREQKLENEIAAVASAGADSLHEVQQLEQRIKTLKSEVLQKQAGVEQHLQSTQLKASYIREMSIEQHYLNKIETMRELGKTQNFFKEEEKARVSYLLGMNNFKLVHQNVHIKKQINQLLRTEYDRLSKQHDFNLPELPFCIVVPTLNNGKDFRYQYNLRSIFNQNYTNYKVVIIDDASTDHNYELIRQYLEDNPVPQKVHLIRNPTRMTAIPNIHKAAYEYCQTQDILALVDGDDELLGVNVFKVFNSVYSRKGLEVLYSNIIVNQKNKHIKRGWSSAYTEIEKKYNKYREGDTRMFPLRSFKVSTFRKVRVSDLKDSQGNWFRSAYDQTICPQVLELSCGKNEYIDEFFYLYNFGLGNNDIEVDPNLNYGIMNEIRHRRKKYECPPT